MTVRLTLLFQIELPGASRFGFKKSTVTCSYFLNHLLQDVKPYPLSYGQVQQPLMTTGKRAYQIDTTP